MLRLAQCEKAVTISEPMGRTPEGQKVREGWKTPIAGARFVRASRVTQIQGFSFSCPSCDFSPIFNDLQGEKVRRVKRFGGPVHHLQKGNFVSTRGARFGPNFVTILPTGVCVCSI
jgi:hypothetical protein